MKICERNCHVFYGLFFAGIAVTFLALCGTILTAVLQKGILWILAGITAVMSGIFMCAAGLLGISCLLWKRNLAQEPNYIVKEID